MSTRPPVDNDAYLLPELSDNLVFQKFSWSADSRVPEVAVHPASYPKYSHVKWILPVVVLRVYPGQGLLVLHRDIKYFVAFASSVKNHPVRGKRWEIANVFDRVRESRQRYGVSAHRTVPHSMQFLGLTARGTVAEVFSVSNRVKDSAVVNAKAIAGIPAKFRDTFTRVFDGVILPQPSGHAYPVVLRHYVSGSEFYVVSDVLNYHTLKATPGARLLFNMPADVYEGQSTVGTAKRPYNLDSVGWAVI